MEVKIIRRKLIKPASPTPHLLRNFRISFTDEMSPTMNVPLILFYINQHGSRAADDHQDTSSSTFKQTLELETSLAQILPKFYPLCGRYMEKDRLIDCGDQGVQYLEAQVNCPLHPLLIQGSTDLKPEEVHDDLLPCPFGAADEATDPLLSIQVSAFECGGLAIGVCISHRVADAATLSTFVSAWAGACRSGDGGGGVIHPVFNSSRFFPGRNLPKFGIGIPRLTMEDSDHFNDFPKIVTRRFVFSGEAISGLRSKYEMIAGKCKHRPTKVQLVSGLILRTFLAIDRTTYECSRASLVLQTVNFRTRTSPPIPDHSCGNFCVFAVAHCTAEQTRTMEEFQDCVNVVGDAAKKTIAECEKIFDPEIDGHMVVIRPFKRVVRMLSTDGGGGDLNTVILNSWCRFPFYEADFRWGKPSWVSVGSLPARNSVLMMDTGDGNGIEAWVNLIENDMSEFRQDPDIRTFTM